ncbi:hypothetical protein OG613_47295 (plasmid) [Streptomyces sp. NBC_00015]|uniref:hypothetical protein n=1 Tax=Streptomyces sp. NBC_00015 TaxID=2903611 RepID=UPI00324D31BE
MTETRTYVADGIAAGRSTYPHRKPVMDTPALAEAIRVQLCTWATSAFGTTIPDPEQLSEPDAVSRLVSNVAEQARISGFDSADTDADAWGMAHLFNADAHSLRAAQGHGDAYLLAALYSLICARAYLRDSYTGRLELNPFASDRMELDEATLIETIRVQVATWAPETFGTVVAVPNRWAMREAADLSDFIADVIRAGEGKYGDMDDDDSIRGMAHLANAYGYALKAGYGHGDTHLFAAVGSLVLAAASLA